MHLRRLGNTGLQVSVLGIGSSPFRHHTPQSAAKLLERAFDLGITYYDTARSYLNGEEAIACVAPHVSDNLIVATKTGARGGTYCLRDLQTSIRTMQRSWIDVWLTHMVATEEEYEQCIDLGGFCDIASAARQAGLIRAYGASFHASTDLIYRALEDRAFDVVMFPFNLIGRETVIGSSIASYRERLLPKARQIETGVVVMKLLAGGEMHLGAPGLKFAADPSSGRDALGGAIRYALMHPDIATSVIGCVNEKELVKAVKAAESIDDGQYHEFLAWTEQFDALNQSECTRCGKCLDVCPERIEIAKIMRQFDQKRFFGMEQMARYKYSKLEIKASACSSCRKCQEVCPEPFEIDKTLAAAHAALTNQPRLAVGVEGER